MAGFRRPRAVGGSNLHVQLDGVVFDPAGGEGILIAFAIGLEAPLAFPRAEQRAELGITESLVRFSAGLEHPDDVVEDLLGALDAV